MKDGMKTVVTKRRGGVWKPERFPMNSSIHREPRILLLKEVGKGGM